MKILILILSLLFPIVANCQTENTDLFLTNDSDTAFWKTNREEDIAIFGLPELNTEIDFVFRRWEPGILLEITKTNDSIRGNVIYFVFEVWENDYEADVFVKEYPLLSSTSKELYKHISKSEFQKVPSDKFIDGWQSGFDGITHIYELKEGSIYSFKNYWTPKSQNGIAEAEFIIKFNQTIEEIGELEKYRKDFNSKIPFVSYMFPGSASVNIKSITKKELRKYKRDRKNRLKETRDNKLR